MNGDFKVKQNKSFAVLAGRHGGLKRTPANKE
jgi:hypothetical protein